MNHIPQDRFLGCVLGQAIGDAIGAPYEGVPSDFIYWTQGPIHELLQQPSNDILRYTDDTQMLIGVAQTLVEHGAIVPEALVARFAKNYDPNRGYGRGARQILEAAREEREWDGIAETIFPGGSFGNGAAMRVAPVGLMFCHDLSQVVEQARLSALPTHRHPLGIEGAQLLALAVAVAVQGPPLDRRGLYDVLQECAQSEEFRWQVKAARKLRRRHSLGFLGNSLPAHRSVMTSIACFTTSPESFEDIVTNAIALGDDTDTLAAMAAALCGAHLGIEAVPNRWLERLEDARQGRTFLRDLTVKLHERYLHRQSVSQPNL